MQQTVSLERKGAVTVVTIERPVRRNAVDADTADQLYAAFSTFDADQGASGSGGRG